MKIFLTLSLSIVLLSTGSTYAASQYQSDMELYQKDLKSYLNDNKVDEDGAKQMLRSFEDTQKEYDELNALYEKQEVKEGMNKDIAATDIVYKVDYDDFTEGQMSEAQAYVLNNSNLSYIDFDNLTTRQKNELDQYLYDLYISESLSFHQRQQTAKDKLIFELLNKAHNKTYSSELDKLK